MGGLCAPPRRQVRLLLRVPRARRGGDVCSLPSRCQDGAGVLVVIWSLRWHLRAPRSSCGGSPAGSLRRWPPHPWPMGQGPASRAAWMVLLPLFPWALARSTFWLAVPCSATAAAAAAQPTRVARRRGGPAWCAALSEATPVPHSSAPGRHRASPWYRVAPTTPLRRAARASRPHPVPSDQEGRAHADGGVVAPSRTARLPFPPSLGRHPPLSPLVEFRVRLPSPPTRIPAHRTCCVDSAVGKGTERCGSCMPPRSPPTITKATQM